MQTITTKIKIEFETTLSNTFNDGEDADVIGEQIEEAIQDYCNLHMIKRKNVSIVENKDAK